MEEVKKNTKIQVKGGRMNVPNLNSIKEKANLEFNNQEYEKAIVLYDEAISSFPL